MERGDWTCGWPAMAVAYKAVAVSERAVIHHGSDETDYRLNIQ